MAARPLHPTPTPTTACGARWGAGLHPRAHGRATTLGCDDILSASHGPRAFQALMPSLILSFPVNKMEIRNQTHSPVVRRKRVTHIKCSHSAQYPEKWGLMGTKWAETLPSGRHYA